MILKHTLLDGENIEIDIQELTEFVACEEIVESPFNEGTAFLPEQIEDTHSRLIIRCFISEEETQKIRNFRPQSICNQAIESYVDKKWKDNYRLGRTVTCNPSESQYEYWIKKSNL